MTAGTDESRSGTEDTRSDDIRQQLGRQLEDKFSAEQLKLLLDEVLAIKKQAWVDISCKKCGQKQRALGEVSDARSVTTALKDLLNQAWGAPKEERTETEFKLVRNVYLVREEELPDVDNGEDVEG